MSESNTPRFAKDHDPRDGDDRGQDQLDWSLDEALSHYLLDEADEATRQRVEAALEADAQLRQEFEARKLSLTLLEQDELVAATLRGASLTEARHEALAQAARDAAGAAAASPETTPKSWLEHRVTSYASAAALLLLVTGAYFWIQSANVTIPQSRSKIASAPQPEPVGPPSPELDTRQPEHNPAIAGHKAMISAKTAAPAGEAGEKKPRVRVLADAFGVEPQSKFPREKKRDIRTITREGREVTRDKFNRQQWLANNPGGLGGFQNQQQSAQPSTQAPLNKRRPLFGDDGANGSTAYTPRQPEILVPVSPGRPAERKLKPEVIAKLEHPGLELSVSGRSVPAIDGAVVQVDEEGGQVLVLSVGENDKVEEGQEFTIFRGDRFIAKVKVDKVMPDMAGCRVLFLQNGESVQAGDKCTTRLDSGGTAAKRRVLDRPTFEDIVSPLTRRPGEAPDAMFFRYWGDNPFVPAARDPLSTFGLDVDTASYTLARNYLKRGGVPPREAVRTEEFVNFFPSHYPAPAETDLALHVEMGPSEFAHRQNVYMLKVGVKAREIPKDQRPPLALTFVVDVSGSMARENRLELVKDSIRLLLTELDERDTVAVVAFSSSAQQILAPTSADQVDVILWGLTHLKAAGRTNVQQGLELGYELAARAHRSGAESRIVVLSDGVANTGLTDPKELLERIEEQRKQGMYLNTFGVGMGNHNDYLLEQLANQGNGMCAYIDTLEEAQRLFKSALLATFFTVAEDAKVQVEFDPQVVLAYRQIGYENRAIADQDFRNDSVDAGEINAGHEMVALYEVETLAPLTQSPATVHLRYRSAKSREVVELSQEVPTPTIQNFEDASPRFRLSVCVATFADHLRGSYWSRSSSLAEVLEHSRALEILDTEGDQRIHELNTLIAMAQTRITPWSKRSQYERLIDELKRNRFLKAQLDDLQTKADSDVLKKLEEQNQQLEDEIRKMLGG